MRPLKPKTIRESLWPTSLLCCFFGGLPPTVKRRWRVLVQAIIVAGTSYFCFFKPVVTRKEKPGIFETIIDATSVVIFYTRTIMQIGSVLLWEFKGARLLEMLLIELTKVDEELKNFGLITNRSKFLWKQLIAVIGFTIMSICGRITHEIVRQSLLSNAVYVSPAGSKRIEVSHVIISLQQFQILSSDLVYVNLVNALCMRFKNLNEVLRQISNPEYKTRINVRTTYRGVRKIGVRKEIQYRCEKTQRNNLSPHFLFEKIDRACRIHKRLMTAAEEFSSVLSLHLCMSIPLITIISLFHSFRMLIIFNAENINILLLLGNIIESMCNTVMFFFIISSCSNLCNEANKLGILLYRIPIFDAIHHSQLQEQSVHNLLRKLHITVGSIFDVDQSLAISVFSAIVKYVVVLLQLPEATRK